MPAKLTMRPPALLHHAGQAGAAEPHRGIHVDVDHALPVGVGHLEERLVGPQRSVVQQRIDRAERLDRFVGDAPAFFRPADVAHDDDRP
jgi:hypothetical protein